MDDVVLPRRSPGVLALLLVVGAAAIGVSLLAPAGSRSQATAGVAGAALATLAAAALIAGSVQRGSSWPSARGISGYLLLIGLADLGFVATQLASDTSGRVGPADAVLLILLIPLTIATRDELRTHFDPRDRREIAIDVWLIADSAAAILYLLIRPAGTNGVTSGTAAVVAILAAAQFVTFGALFLWVPTRPHFLQSLAFAEYAIAT